MATAMTAIRSSVNADAESFKNINIGFRASPELIEDPGIFRKDLSLKERIGLCLEIAERARDDAWGEVYNFICENLGELEKVDYRREFWYMLVTLAGKKGRKDLLDLLERKRKELKRGWKKLYDNLTQEFLLKLEAKGIIKRIPAKPVDFLVDTSGKLESLKAKVSDILFNIDRYKGLIYVEKAGVAEKLKDLVSLGFIVITGQGFPTVFFRRFAQYHKLFILHDADKSGRDIERCITDGSEHMKKIDKDYALKFVVKNAVGLGLTIEDAEKLGLPSIPETESRRRRGYLIRYELEALTALEAEGITNPYLAYTLAKLKLLGADLKPSLPDDREALKSSISWIVKRSLNEIIDDLAEEVVDEVLKKYGSARETDFKLRRDAVEEGAKLIVKRLYDMIVEKKGIDYEVYESDTAIMMVPSGGAQTSEEYVEKLMEETGANKIIKMLTK